MNAAIDLAAAREMLLFAAQKIVDSKAYLTEVDSAIGDGDHGIGMETGCKKILEVLGKRESFVDVAELFRETGKAMIFTMGGASGIIFGSLFQGGAAAGQGVQMLDGGLFTRMMQGALAAIQRKGKAQPGDKTMVDALAPAVQAMEAAGTQLPPVLEAAAAGAARGVEATKQMVARFGQAVQLGERSLGYQDAGATSVLLLFQAMSDYVHSRT